MPDVTCKDCGRGMTWGTEYYPDNVPGTPASEALCPECYHA